jgi:nitrate reductase gamma subunit
MVLPVDFSKIIPTEYVDIAGYSAAVVVALGLIYRALKWRRDVPPIFGYFTLVLFEARQLGFKKIIRVLLKVIFFDFITQASSFQTWRSVLIHLSIFYGFVGLAITTTLVFIFNASGHPLPLDHPFVILGTVSGAIILAGLTVALLRRSLIIDVRSRTSRYDSLFITILYITILSGFLEEIASRTDFVSGANLFYYIHLTFIAMLILTAPFTKFIHAVKIPLLILFNRYRYELIANGILGSGVPEITVLEPTYPMRFKK